MKPAEFIEQFGHLAEGEARTSMAPLRAAAPSNGGE